MKQIGGLDELPRVKPKQNYEWFQDQKSVKLRQEIKGTSSKKLDVFISDLILKINIQEKKYAKIYDLQHEVDFMSKENTVVYANDYLEVTMMKKQDITWTDFEVQDLSKDDIRQRREQSFKRKEEEEQNFLKKKSDLKNQYDQHATREQMKQEDQQRETLKQRQNQERQRAEEQIFSDEKDVTTALEVKTSKKQDNPEFIYTRKVDSSIFSDRDIRDYEQKILELEEVIPKPRQVIKKDIQFTEKVFPHLAMRETHLKEAPLPKIKQSAGEKAGSDLENKNPLWLKDKGDEFYRNQDYYSALNAYNQALQLDKDLIICVSNKSLINLQLFNYEECYVDCVRVIDWYLQLKDEEKKAKFLRVYLKAQIRKSIALSWKGNLEQARENLLKLTTENENLKVDEEIRKQVEESVRIIDTRIESIRLKRVGDSYYMIADYDRALENYKKGLENDENETILANISITYLKRNENELTVQYCDQCIDRIKKFTSFTNFSPQLQQSSFAAVNGFLMKLFLRKAKAQQNLALMKEAFDTIKKALQIDEQNKEARQLFAQIEKSITHKEVLENKERANTLMREKKFNEALEVYNECLKKADQSETLDYLALLLNKCACYLHLNLYDDIVSSTLRGLKIIRSYKNRVISWENLKLSKEERQKLRDFEVRFLIRRANAYLQLNQIYNAKVDFQEALKLDPENEQIKKDYEKISQSLN